MLYKSIIMHAEARVVANTLPLLTDTKGAFTATQRNNGISTVTRPTCLTNYVRRLRHRVISQSATVSVVTSRR